MESYGKILLVEDDVSLAQWIKEYLLEQSFSVSHLDRGDTVIAKLNNEHFDLILLDIMLPGLDGLEVCRRIRSFSQVPIIMMTARADEFDEVVGLEVGANDYVIKPVRPRALLARIKATLRHAAQEPQQQTGALSFGQLEIQAEAKRVTLNGNEIKLSTNLFALLLFLANNAGKVVDRDTVFKALKGREYDGLDRRFDVMISTLRKKLNDDPQNPTRIKTVWGKGYLFVSDAWDNV